MGYRYLNTGTAVPVFAAEPPLATEGSLYYNSTSDIFYISNGTQWNLVSNANPATTGGTVTIDALSEGGTFSYDLGTDFTDDVDTDAQLTYTLASGTLPSGCTLPTTGNSEFTGTASGVSSNTNYTWTIKVTDTSGGTATQDYQQTINQVAPTVTGGTVTISSVSEGGSASYDVDTDFTFVSGAVFSAYSLQSGTLPSGLSLNTATGVISGTMGNTASTTAYTFTIRGTDTDGDTVDQSYSWSITTVTPTVTGGTVAISATSEGASASYDVDTNFSYPTGSTFSAYSLQSGSLPNGLSLNTTSGVISGTAGNSGSASFTIRATDTDGDTADQAYSWTITNVAPTSTGGTVTISSVNEGSSASYDVDANFTFTTGSTFSAYSLQSGSLPSGLSLNTSTGVISGTMGAVSSTTAYSFTIRGTDTDGDTADQAYSWTITNVVMSAVITGTGNATSTVGGYQAHTFNGSGTFTPNKAGTVDILMVAGGGGGATGVGDHKNGGGGAGGLIFKASFAVTAQTYNIVIGAGATRVDGSDPVYYTPGNKSQGNKGNDTTGFGLTALGGGGGASTNGGGDSNSDGGSGGGGHYDLAGGTGTQPTSSSGGFGNAGGTKATEDFGYGGGGAGAVGYNDVPAASTARHGKWAGGEGLYQVTVGGTAYNFASIFGTASGEIISGNAWFAGGGGGGEATDGDLHYGFGGEGGGGKGAYLMSGTGGSWSSTSAQGQDGFPNTGGGGGGARGGAGGAGGSGIVIVRVRT
jgi:hypothetical protein